MSRTKNLINYPHLNDCKGDISKKWYVEFSFRLPARTEEYRFRVYDGLCSGTDKERRQSAEKLIAEINQYLKSGEYLNHPDNYRPVRERDSYRPEAESYNSRERDYDLHKLIDRFIAHGSPGWGTKTVQDYRSKLKYFAIWWYDERTDKHSVIEISRKQLLPFWTWYADRGTSRATCKKMAQVVRIFFDWLEEVDIREDKSNPVSRVPKLGAIVDEASVPFTSDERGKLKACIEKRDPWLWLACELQYYCAIRPGTELRLSKVGDIDWEHRTITVSCERAKARRTDIVGVPEHIVQYMLRLGLQNWSDDHYIFGRYGTPALDPVGKNTLRNRFNRYRDELGISPDRKFYSWKHTGAVEAVDNGIGVWELKQHMRHKSVRTTEEYLKNRSPDVHSSEKYIKDI